MTRESGFNSPSHESYEEQVSHIKRVRNLGNGAIESTTDTGPIAMHPYGPMAPPAPNTPAAKELEAREAQRIESLKILDKDAFKLGDLNPLIHPTDLGRSESVEAVRYTIYEKIRQYGGVMPEVLESAIVSDGKNAERRFIARFEVTHLSREKISLLEKLVKETYGVSVRTLTNSKGDKIQAEGYPPTQPGDKIEDSLTTGWYMGIAPIPTSPLYPGLFVFKDYGETDPDNFSDQNQEPYRYIVEIREAGQHQTDLVTFVTQVSTVLSKGELPDRGQLLYETYYELIRLGLKDIDKESIYGMSSAQDMIMRELIIPLASPDISGSVDEDPQSVLMVGVPGTGKTLIAEWLLQKDTGLFILPIDPFQLQREVALPKEKQTLLPRIAEIARITGRRVVLHVDDIENMVGQQAATNSTMLNLMAGVQESGFYIIASTNYPDQINKSLIQPQRFSVLIHCGLQDQDARYEILKIHAGLESKKLGKQLFISDEVRDDILREVAKHTENFTPRYLSNIATVAKSFLIDRVAREKGKIIGLTEEDLEGHTFDVEDWERAFAEVSSKYDSAATGRDNKKMEQFVKKYSHSDLGFKSNIDSTPYKRIFSNELHDKMATIKAESQREDV